jgi:hypothetical protein
MFKAKEVNVMNTSKQTVDNMLETLEQALAPSESGVFRGVSVPFDESQHPELDLLYRYTCGELEPDDAAQIRQHLILCPVCNGKTLRIMRITNDWKSEIRMIDQLRQYAANWADGIVQSGVPVRWATALWQPEWAGTPVYASDILEQQHTFSSSDGEIEITCSWRDTYGSTPAYLTISWFASIERQQELWALFLDPSTKHVLAEIPLGKYLEGGKHLNSQMLGFNPSRDKWAVAILLKENDA